MITWSADTGIWDVGGPGTRITGTCGAGGTDGIEAGVTIGNGAC